MSDALGSITGGNTQGSTTSTTPYIMSGPTIGAANNAANAQIAATGAATAAATQNTNAAIQALMGQYNTALTYANPAINTGNQANAQMNYMLGLPAVAPNAAPTAPTLESVQKSLGLNASSAANWLQSNQQLNQNIAITDAFKAAGGGAEANQSTMTPNGIKGTPGSNTFVGTTVVDPITGQQYQLGQGPSTGNASASAQNFLQGAGAYGTMANGQLGQVGTGADLQKDILQSLAQPGLDAAQQTYKTQLDQYNKQKAVYDQYAAKGQASAADIGDIVQNQPGFQFQQAQGINAIQNAASASGQLNSGNMLQELNKFGQGLSQTYYQNYMGNLQNLSATGAQATSGAVSGANNLGNQVANQYSNLGTTSANAALAAGQALASSYLTPVANQQVIQTPTTSTSSSSQSGAGNVGGLLSGAAAIGGLFCDAALKEVVSTPSTAEILDRIQELHIDKWKYKGIDQEHIGPYAGEFKELFGVGDGKTINLIDLFGVMLGSIKELSAKVKELESK